MAVAAASFRVIDSSSAFACFFNCSRFGRTGRIRSDMKPPLHLCVGSVYQAATKVAITWLGLGEEALPFPRTWRRLIRQHHPNPKLSFPQAKKIESNGCGVSAA